MHAMPLITRRYLRLIAALITLLPPHAIFHAAAIEPYAITADVRRAIDICDAISLRHCHCFLAAA